MVLPALTLIHNDIKPCKSLYRGNIYTFPLKKEVDTLLDPRGFILAIDPRW